MHVAKLGLLEIVQTLLKKGANVDIICKVSSGVDKMWLKH